jgi:lysophospholipase L1-like esterase
MKLSPGPILALFGSCLIAACSSKGGGNASWVGTWACGPQLTETANLPPAPGLTGNTLRQIVYVSLGGGQVRVRLSNAYGDGPVTMNAVHLAVSKGGSTIDPATDKALAFGGQASVTIQMGASVVSDPLEIALTPLTTMAVTIAFGATPGAVTGHPGSRENSYLQAGNAVTAASLPSAAMVAHWYYLTGIDVDAPPPSAAIVTLGDSLTDGRGSMTDGNDRWPDDLARRLQPNAATADVAVLNLGIGGNAVVTGGLGPTAEQRFTSDVLGQSGAKWLIVFEGVNDIGASSGPSVAMDLITAYGQFIDMAHAHDLKAYGIPITPFGGSMYDSPANQMARDTVNAWIRAPGHFDAVIDMDPVVANPAAPTRLLPAYDSGDELHLNAPGYQKMADSIDLTLFSK